MTTCTKLNDTVKLATLLRHVIPTINNIPHELGVDLLRQSFTEFIRRTQLLATEITIEVQRNVSDYELPAPAGYEIHMIREAGFPGHYITEPGPDYWYNSQGMRFKVVSNKYIILRDTPTRDGTNPFCVIAALIPNECIETIPREISVPYGAYIAKGALKEALLYKSKPWYDPGLSAKFEREFNVGVNAGKNLQLMNRGGSDMRMRGRRWV